jgi:hypothetical protein
MKLQIVLVGSFALSVAAFVPKCSTRSAGPTTITTTQLYNDLWGEPPIKDGQSKEMSKALPFAPRPKLLDGSLPGDAGFE